MNHVVGDMGLTLYSLAYIPQTGVLDRLLTTRSPLARPSPVETW